MNHAQISTLLRVTGCCNNELNGFKCTCIPGFLGSTCEANDFCLSGPCSNGGTCNNELNGFTCTCIPGFLGSTCEANDFCLSGPCSNGGTCNNELNGFTCTCIPGFLGSTCEGMLIITGLLHRYDNYYRFIVQ
ncbi:hypothetical protein CAPTEDRAFT_113032 [Capitella teleta]|uniref:EGF-like domain-containing protein n=1 Tax=Capitella teleta TaxID=283909 RepID=R7V5F9_CAPTE|nr:hypothetical protein CAPTEDRAFT_113032 [Capitella teleta]|eukprot:ELU13794.1 hypothetical protein CAPTEDRAFT_113032 [Capitella teleta]